jgi:amino acid adenylation domain-containing protein
MSRESPRLPIDHGGPVDRPFESFPVAALDHSLIDRFEAIVNRFPDRLAVQDSTCRLTYAELAATSTRIAMAISSVAIREEGPVAILMRSEARFVSAIIGVLATGRAYVPLDAAQPLSRNEVIARQSGAAALISADELAHEARRLFPGETPIIDVGRLEERPPIRPLRRPGPDDIAYILYTSGSTGTPKGVYQNHRGHLHDLMQLTNTLHLTSEDRLSLVYPISAASPCRDLYGALLNGGSIHLLPPKEFEPRDLAEEIRKRGITVLHSSPTLFRRLAEAVQPGDRLDSLRVLYLAGDRVDWSDVQRFRKICRPEAFFYITFASTECMVHTHWFVDERLQATSTRLPIGRTAPDWNVTLVEENGRAVADGEVGEVVVSSRYLALGYWSGPSSRQPFPADPRNPGNRMFHTGDLCRRRPDGLLEYVGRKDQQVKIHGYRIEPAEIEHAFLHYPEIAEAVVLVRKTDGGIPKSLVAYVRLNEGVKNLLPRHIAAMVQQRLPGYMIPWPIFIVADFPRFASLKIDRVKLTQLDVEGEKHASRAPEEPITEEVVKIFEKVLEVINATPDDNVASLGGDSLQAIEIAAELEFHFAIAIPAQVMESAQTIRELAEWIANEKLIREPA